MTFKGTPVNNKVRLNWPVTKNHEIQHFTVERSIDGVHVTLIDTVSSQSSASRYAAYRLVDDVPGLRTSYVCYRVRVSARNGEVQYGKVIKVALSNGAVTGITIQPNPVRDRV